MSKKILIVGDSWGMGEWGHIQPQNTYGVTHNGLETYLQNDGYTIENISTPGITAKANADNLENYSSLHTYDNIIFLMSGIFRNNKEFSYITDVESLLARHQELTDYTLQKLNNLDVRILLLGGLTKIPENLIKYENLTSVIDSIVEYLTPLEQSMFLSDVSNQINFNADIDLVNYVYECNEMWESLQNYKDFIPDGAHPNRNGIYKYYQEIKKHLI